MNWSADRAARKAFSEDGNYLVTWEESVDGNWFNGWHLTTPLDESTRVHIAGSYNGESVKKVCAEHAERIRRAGLSTPQPPQSAA